VCRNPYAWEAGLTGGSEPRHIYPARGCYQAHQAPGGGAAAAAEKARMAYGGFHTPACHLGKPSCSRPHHAPPIYTYLPATTRVGADAETLLGANTSSWHGTTLPRGTALRPTPWHMRRAAAVHACGPVRASAAAAGRTAAIARVASRAAALNSSSRGAALLSLRYFRYAWRIRHHAAAQLACASFTHL